MRNYDAVFHMVIVGDSLYYGSSADDALHSLATTDGTERWSFRTDAPLRVAPSVADGRVFFGSDDGHAYCVDAASGQQIWKSESPVQEKWIRFANAVSVVGLGRAGAGRAADETASSAEPESNAAATVRLIIQWFVYSCGVSPCTSNQRIDKQAGDRHHNQTSDDELPGFLHRDLGH